jgi:hypothetical protein
MSDEEIEKLAELIFQKLMAKQEELDKEYDNNNTWTTTSYIWSTNVNSDDTPYKGNSKELFTQRLVALNIEKQELLVNEDYDGLIKLQKTIDEIKEQLKKYKD